MNDLPTPVWSGTFRLFGFDMKCHILDDGLRIIEAESVEDMIISMSKNVSLETDEFALFYEWQKADLTIVHPFKVGSRNPGCSRCGRPIMDPIHKGNYG